MNNLMMSQAPILLATNSGYLPYTITLARDVSRFQLAFFDAQKGNGWMNGSTRINCPDWCRSRWASAKRRGIPASHTMSFTASSHYLRWASRLMSKAVFPVWVRPVVLVRPVGRGSGRSRWDW